MAAIDGQVFSFENGGEGVDDVPKSLRPNQGILRLDVNLHPRRRSSGGSADDRYTSLNLPNVNPKLNFVYFLI